MLHRFNGSDGAYPSANLIMDSAGDLYGTTANGEHLTPTNLQFAPDAKGNGVRQSYTA